MRPVQVSQRNKAVRVLDVEGNKLTYRLAVLSGGLCFSAYSLCPGIYRRPGLLLEVLSLEANQYQKQWIRTEGKSAS
jgi:hypothetical protein